MYQFDFIILSSAFMGSLVALLFVFFIISFVLSLTLFIRRFVNQRKYKEYDDKWNI